MLQIAMTGELPYTVLRDMIFAHPTLAELLQRSDRGSSESRVAVSSLFTVILLPTGMENVSWRIGCLPDSRVDATGGEAVGLGGLRHGLLMHASAQVIKQIDAREKTQKPVSLADDGHHAALEDG